MANKLKDLFADEEEKYAEKISFENYDSYKAFGETLKEVMSTGQVKKVNGVKSIQTSLLDGENKYPIKTVENVSEVFVGPYHESISFPIEIDGKTDSINLIKMQLEDHLEIRSQNKSVVSMQLLMFEGQHKMQFTYNIHLENAVSMEMLIMEYKRTLAFVNVLFIKEKNIPERDEMIDFFEKSIRRFEKLVELENVLNIKILPESIKNEHDTDYLTEKLYLMLVKKKKIRSNDRLNFVEKVQISDGEVGKEIFAAYINKIDCELYEQKFTIYTVNCIFNAIISKIEEDDNGERKVYFTDTDVKPMYRAYAGLLSEQEAEKEQKNIMSKIQEYKDAKKINEYWSELL